jgi:hypothetical protein
MTPFFDNEQQSCTNKQLKTTHNKIENEQKNKLILFFTVKKMKGQQAQETWRMGSVGRSEKGCTEPKKNNKNKPKEAE